jgi:hypothetical protein
MYIFRRVHFSLLPQRLMLLSYLTVYLSYEEAEHKRITRPV